MSYRSDDVTNAHTYKLYGDAQFHDINHMACDICDPPKDMRHGISACHNNSLVYTLL